MSINDYVSDANDRECYRRVAMDIDPPTPWDTQYKVFADSPTTVQELICEMCETSDCRNYPCNRQQDKDEVAQYNTGRFHHIAPDR